MVFYSDKSSTSPEVDVVSWLFDECLHDPEKPLFHDVRNGSALLSWRAARTFIRQLVAGLRVQGVKPGDCVYTLLPSNNYFWPIGFAVIGCGGVFCPGSTLLRPQETADAFSSAQAVHLIVHPAFFEHARAISRQSGLFNVIVFDMYNNASVSTGGGDMPFSTVSLRSLLDHGEQDWQRVRAQSVRHAIAMRGFTSGTSGPSKVPQLSHYSLVARACGLINKKIQSNMTILHIIGQSHISAWAIVCLALLGGASVHYLPFTTVSALLDGCRTIRPTYMILPPPIAASLTQEMAVGDESLHSLASVTLQGMTMSPRLMDKLQLLLRPGAALLRTYGSTETGSIAKATRWAQSATSVGPLCPNVSIKLIDLQCPNLAEITTPNTIGEICVNAPALFTSYLNASPVSPTLLSNFCLPSTSNKTITSTTSTTSTTSSTTSPTTTTTMTTTTLTTVTTTTTTTDNTPYLRTGDLGHIDDHNEWHIHGRCTENFKVSYESVNVEDLASVLTEHESVRDACVAPVWVAGEVSPLIRAFVVVKPSRPTGRARKRDSVLDYDEEIGVEDAGLYGGSAEGGKGEGNGKPAAGDVTEAELTDWMNARVAVHKRITAGIRFLEKIERNAAGKVVRWKLDVTP